MVKARPAAGGGRWVEISPERLSGWLDGFYGRHDGATEQGLVGSINALVCGSDRSMIDAVLADRRLYPLALLRHPHLLESAKPPQRRLRHRRCHRTRTCTVRSGESAPVYAVEPG